MGKATTVVKFIWRRGIRFPDLSKIVFDFCAQAGHPCHILSHHDKSASGNFLVMRYKAEPPFVFPHGPWEDIIYPNKVTRFIEYTDKPWEDDPWMKPGILCINWVVLESRGLDRCDKWWGSFTTWVQESIRYSSDKMPDKVHVMSMSFEGEFTRFDERTERNFEALHRKYHAVKELYRTLDCDEVFAEPGWIDPPTRHRFPHCRHMDLRLAKEGTQVLVRQMEEGRPRTDLDRLRSRIFIDPPGVQALSPEEYARAADLGVP